MGLPGIMDLPVSLLWTHCEHLADPFWQDGRNPAMDLHSLLRTAWAGPPTIPTDFPPSRTHPEPCTLNPKP